MYTLLKHTSIPCHYWLVTLRETKIAPENGSLQQESPFPKVYFQVLRLFQGGSYIQIPIIMGQNHPIMTIRV